MIYLAQLNNSDYHAIVKFFRIFNTSIDHNHELALKINGDIFRLANIIGCNMDFIAFEVLDDNDESLFIIQHYSQLNLVIVPILKKSHNSLSKRIGFKMLDNQEVSD